MADTETTSPEVATFAATVLRMDDAELVRRAYTVPELFRSMAASLLTQTRDAPVEGAEPAPRRQRAPRSAES